MPLAFGGQKLLLLDACCLISLYATRHIEEVLRVIPMKTAIADSVAAEALYVLRGGDGDDADERDIVDLRPLIASGLVEVLSLDIDEEVASFVAFAVDLDDGGAKSCAMAVHRDAVIATDDQKALRVLSSRASQVRVCTTTQLLKSWSESGQVSAPVLKQVLLDVRRRARFEPSNRDPLHAWWQASLL